MDRRPRPRLPRRTRAAARAAAAALPMLVAACAGYSPDGLPAGSPTDAVVARMGAPKARFATPDGGQRLEFWRGRFAHHGYMVDFDPDGRMRGWQQVRTEPNFWALRTGMTKDEVLYRIGHPSEVQYLPRLRHQLWSYRYVSPFCVWFQVSLDTADRVVTVSNNNDPLCTVPF